MSTRGLTPWETSGTDVGGGYEPSVDFVDSGLLLPRHLCTRWPNATEPPGGGELSRWRPLPEGEGLDARITAAASSLLAALEQDGLSAAVLHAGDPTLWPVVMEVARRAPSRLKAVLPLPIGPLPEDLATVCAHGLSGFALSGRPPAPDARRWARLLEGLAAHRLHLHLEIPPETWEHVLPLVLGRGVAVRLVLPRTADHLCRAWRSFRVLERYAVDEDLWISFVPVPVRAQGLGRLLDRLFEVAGPDRILWGSGRDPERRGHGLADQVAALEDLLPDPSVRLAVAGLNARVLAFGAPRAKREH